jgi:hypothetical protein
MTDPITAWVAARDAAQPLHDRAIMLGYVVSATATGELGREPEVSFWVRRFDQSGGDERTFATLNEVSSYLDHLETLPVYCLELENNSRVETTPNADGTETWVTDTKTGEKFAVRTQDIEAITRLCVHAESQPTIGNWEPNP